MKREIIFAAVIIIGLLLILIAWRAPTAPEITIQPEEPAREYIRKYPVAGGGYQYILVREYELDVEFIDTISGGNDD